MGANLIDPAIGEAGDIDAAMVVHAGRVGRAGAHQQQPPLRLWLRPAHRGVRRRRACCRPTTATSPRSRAGARRDTRAQDPVQDFFIARYAEAYVAELDHFVDCVETRRRAAAPGSPRGARRCGWPMRRRRARGPAARSGSRHEHGPADRRAGGRALPRRAADGDRRRRAAAVRRRAGRSSATATSPGWARRCSTPHATRCRPSAPITSRPWRSPRSPTPRRATGGR